MLSAKSVTFSVYFGNVPSLGGCDDAVPATNSIKSLTRNTPYV
jgi:hypothetical protein